MMGGHVPRSRVGPPDRLHPQSERPGPDHRSVVVPHVRVGHRPGRAGRGLDRPPAVGLLRRRPGGRDHHRPRRGAGGPDRRTALPRDHRLVRQVLGGPLVARRVHDLEGRPGHPRRRPAGHGGRHRRGQVPARSTGAVAADAGAPALPVAQAVGRLGNWFNQELLRPPDRPAVGSARSTPCTGPSATRRWTTFHPTFLYEGLWNLALAGFIVLAGRKVVLRPGSLVRRVRDRLRPGSAVGGVAAHRRRHQGPGPPGEHLDVAAGHRRRPAVAVLAGQPGRQGGHGAAPRR